MASASIRQRLIVTLLGLAAAVWLASALTTYRDARREIAAVLDAHLAQTAALLAAQVSHEYLELGSESLGGVLPYAQSVVFQVWDRGGSLVLRSPNAPTARLAPSRPGFADVQVGGRDWRAFARLREGDALEVLVAEDRSGREHIERRFVARALWPLAIGLPLLGILGWAAIGRALRPLRVLSDGVARRNASDLSPLVVPAAPAELEPLVDQVNSLLRRIDRSLEAERRFTDHAAHELRTPVAAMRAQAEAATAAASLAEARSALVHVIGDCDRLARLVGQLLLAGRVDQGARPAFTRCDLAVVARAAVAELAPAALERDVEIGLTAPAPAWVRGDPVLLEALVRNLVDNAIRHGREGGIVSVTVEQPTAGAVLVVEDDGPGVAEVERAELGRPFFRAADVSAPGSGLGLSIVRRIAEDHAAGFSAGEARAHRGLRIEISFPRVAD